MSEPSFDPTGFFTFDLEGGSVRSRTGKRLLLLSDNVIAPLVAAAVANGDLTAVRRLGRHVGDEVRQSIGEDTALDELPFDVVLTHLSGSLALFGWGKLHVERWGAALAVTLDQSPALDEDRLAMAALLGGLFSSISGREVAAVPLAEPTGFLLVDPGIAETVWNWARANATVGEIVAQLTFEGAAE